MRLEAGTLTLRFTSAPCRSRARTILTCLRERPVAASMSGVCCSLFRAFTSAPACPHSMITQLMSCTEVARTAEAVVWMDGV